jgi:iron(III) transport system permease protein
MREPLPKTDTVKTRESDCRGPWPIELGTLVWLAAVILVVFLVCVPVGFLAYESLTTEAGGLSLAHYPRVLRRAYVLEAVRNTIAMAVGIAGLGVLIAVPLAFGVSRTNMAGKALVKNSVIVAIMTPPFLLAMAYIILAGPNAGLANRLIRWLFNLSSPAGPFNVFSLWAMIVLGVPTGAAIIFLQAFPALENMDPSLEEAARMSGVGPLGTALTVTLPLMRPAIFSGVLLSVGTSIAMYGVPHMLNIKVLTLAIREAVLVMDFKAAAVLSVLVTVMSLAAIFLYRVSVGTSKRYQTITARGFRPNVMRLGASRHLFTAFGVAYAFFAFVLPYTTLGMASFLRSLGLGFTWENLTLRNYAQLIQTPLPRLAFQNSMVLGVATASVVTALGVVIGYLIVRLSARGRQVLDYLTGLPMGIAGTALAAGLIFMYLTPPLSALGLYATLWLLLIAYATRQLPVAVRYCQGALMQVSSELEEASRLCGATWLQTLWGITLPLVKTGIVYAWILVFIQAFPELSSSILLRNVGTDVVATAILDLWDGSGGLPVAAAFAAVVFVLITVMVALAQKLGRRSLIGTSRM